MVRRIIVQDANRAQVNLTGSYRVSQVQVRKVEENSLTVTDQGQSVIISFSQSETGNTSQVHVSSQSVPVSLFVNGTQENPVTITVITRAVQVTSVSLGDIQALLLLKENDLGTPLHNNQVLGSSTDKTRSWLSHNSIHGLDGGGSGKYYHLSEDEYNALKNGFYRGSTVTVTTGMNSISFLTPFDPGTSYSLPVLRLILMDGSRSDGIESSLTETGFNFYSDYDGELTYLAIIDR